MSSHEHILQLDPNERVLYTVKRSLFGLLPHFIFATVSFLVFLAGIFYIARFQDQLNLPVGQVVAIAGGAVLVAGQDFTQWYKVLLCRFLSLLAGVLLHGHHFQ